MEDKKKIAMFRWQFKMSTSEAGRIQKWLFHRERTAGGKVKPG